MSFTLGRRRLLQALGLTAVASLPPFRVGVLHAAPPPPVLRFVPTFGFFGVLARDFFPDTAGTDVPLASLPSLPKTLTPLTPFRDQVIVMKGLQLATTKSLSFTHIEGSFVVYSGVDFIMGQSWAAASGPTLDQVLAAKIGTDTPFPSLQFGSPDGIATVFYQGKQAGLSPMSDPAKTFNRLFGQFGASEGDPTELMALHTERKSIFDHLTKDLSAISGRLSCNDKQRLEVHLASIREVEKTLSTAGGLVSACGSVPGAPPIAATGDAKAAGDTSPLMMDMLAASLACGLTRIASMQWSSDAGAVEFDFLGLPTGHHGLSHYDASPVPGDPLDNYQKVNQWLIEQVAHLAAKLKTFPESDGKTLLDHTLISYLSDCGDGSAHSITDVPALIVGGAGGQLKSGRYLQFNNDRNQNDMLNSIYNAMTGEARTTYGDPKYCKGPLPLS